MISRTRETFGPLVGQSYDPRILVEQAAPIFWSSPARSVAGCKRESLPAQSVGLFPHIVGFEAS